MACRLRIDRGGAHGEGKLPNAACKIGLRILVNAKNKRHLHVVMYICRSAFNLSTVLH